MTDATNMSLAEIFLLYATEQMARARKKPLRFVYYTSAATAERILRNEEIWMRNATTMNDFMETRHGYACLLDTWHGGPGKRLKQVLAPYFPSVCTVLEQTFDQWCPQILNGTYLTCVSEHDDAEDLIGRLSMWRAYGQGSGVALVMNNTAFLSKSDALHAYTSPVAYLKAGDFAKKFDDVVDSIHGNLNVLRDQQTETILSWLFNVLRFAVVSTKHPGFAEEREWRVIYSPALEPSERLEASVEVIRGIPQRVYKIPLHNVPEKGLVGAEIPELIERVIIGPSPFPSATADAFIQLLQEAGVPDASSKVVVSNIPLRTS